MNLFRFFSWAARLGATALFCAGGAAMAQEAENKAGEFELEGGGLVINLSESAQTPSIPGSDRNFAEALSLSAGMEIAPAHVVRATLDVAVAFRAPATISGAGLVEFTMDGGTLIVRDRTRLTLFQNGMRFTVTANVIANTVVLGNVDGGSVVVNIAAGETLNRLGTVLTVENAPTPLTALGADGFPDANQLMGIGNIARLSGCRTNPDATGGVGASGRFYLLDDFVDVSLEGGFYATVQKGVFRLECQLQNVMFGGIPEGQSARAMRSGEWSANSIYLGIRVEDEFGPAAAYFRVGGNYWTREYDLSSDFHVDGLRYKVDANGREYYVPAPALRWRTGGDFLSDSKQEGFDSHFGFGVRAGRLSASWVRNKQDDFRVDAFQFSYIHEF